MNEIGNIYNEKGNDWTTSVDFQCNIGAQLGERERERERESEHITHTDQK